MELVITTNLNSFPKLIEFNYPELKSALKESLTKYQGLVYNENEIKDARADRAALNKMKASIDSERKKMKEICLDAFADFDTKTRELSSMVNEQISGIDKQIKKYENEKKEVKRLMYRAFYEDQAGDIAEIICFENVFKENWLNSSASEKAVKTTIVGQVEKIKSDMETIRTFGGDIAIQCISVYSRTLDLSTALAEKARIEALKNKIEEQRPTAEEIAPVKVIEEVLQSHDPDVGEPGYREPIQDPEKFTLEFRVIATSEQLKALKAFLKDNSIHYERV